MDEHLSSQGNTATKMSKVTIAIAMVFSVIFVLCSTALAVQFNSGETYTFTTPSPPSGQVYTYLWSASDGSSTEYSNRIFNWTAPLVDAPKNVTINVTVTASGGCRAGHEMELTVLPRPIGQITIEELLDGSQNNVLLGSTISYTIDITNTGKTTISYLPLIDDYPEKFLKPVSSDPAWKEDNGSSLIWSNLLSAPLAPGQSVKVSVRFHVIDITNLAVINTVRAEGAKNGDGSILGPQKAGYTIAGIGYECPTLGPDTACIGEEITFSGIPGLSSYRWAANDSNGHSVGGFNDSTKADVKWTPPGRGVFEISFNNGLCKQLVTVKQCKFGQISLEKSLDSSPDGVKLGAVASYTVNITNTGQTNVTILPLSDYYPNAFLKPVSSNPQWSTDNGSSLIWSNLLNAPLAPGHSIKVSTSFRAFNITDQSIANLVGLDGAKDDTGAALPSQVASSKINGIKYECQKLGPDTTCDGAVVPLSAHLALPSYQWKALDAQGNSVGSFDDPTKDDVKWTPPGPGTFEISFNNLVCKQTIIVNRCNSGVQVEKLFEEIRITSSLETPSNTP